MFVYALTRYLKNDNFLCFFVDALTAALKGVRCFLSRFLDFVVGFVVGLVVGFRCRIRRRIS